MGGVRTGSENQPVYHIYMTGVVWSVAESTDIWHVNNTSTEWIEFSIKQVRDSEMCVKCPLITGQWTVNS